MNVYTGNIHKDIISREATDNPIFQQCLLKRLKKTFNMYANHSLSEIEDRRLYKDFLGPFVNIAIATYKEHVEYHQSKYHTDPITLTAQEFWREVVNDYHLITSIDKDLREVIEI